MEGTTLILFERTIVRKDQTGRIRTDQLGRVRTSQP